MGGLVETFSYLDFVKYAKNTKRSRYSHEHNCNASERRGDNGWSGTRSFHEAYELAITGWDSGINQLSSEDKVIVDGGASIVNDIHGSFIDMGKFIEGSPDCMVRFTNEIEALKPFLTMFVNLGYHAGVEGDTAIQYCKKLVEIVNQYGKEYDVRIFGCFVCKGRSDISTFIEIKKNEERLVLNTIAFSFHPSFFRRIWFKYLETTDAIDREGYARHGDFKQAVNMYAHKENINEFLVVPSLQDDGLEWDVEDIEKIKL